MSTVRPVIVITHAAFSVERRLSLASLLHQLRLHAPTLPVLVQNDEEAKGSLWCWRQAHESALRLYLDATHTIWLPDDAVICDDFGKIIEACIQARPGEVFDCFVNHPALRKGHINTCWYSTADGYTGVGGVMPRALLEEHLRWRDRRPELGSYANDAGVNLWAADTGRLIYKTAWSLVQHDTSVASLDGHDEQASDGHERVGMHPVMQARAGVASDVMNFLARTYLAPEAHMPGRATGCTRLPLTYKSNVFDLVRRVRPARWNIDAMYQACEPTPEGGKARVVIVVPVYRESEEIMRLTRPSRDAVMEDLETHGVECIVWTPPGDSHVDRMRQRATHGALKMGATHILWWDADIECLDPKTVRRMLVSGHDIVAGAVPFKNDSRRVVCNLWPKDAGALLQGGELPTLPGGYVEVMHAGSGFMLISRHAILELMMAYPERSHLSRSPGDRLEPLWAIWDAQVGGPADNIWERTFLTEDWNICRLWQEIGGKVYVHTPSRFKHYGTHGFEGSFAESFGLEVGP